MFIFYFFKTTADWLEFKVHKIIEDKKKIWKLWHHCLRFYLMSSITKQSADVKYKFDESCDDYSRVGFF